VSRIFEDYPFDVDEERRMGFGKDIVLDARRPYLHIKASRDFAKGATETDATDLTELNRGAAF
jgi:hypothetical protein